MKNEKQNTMKILMVKPDEKAFETEIGTDLKSLQNTVGGTIEVIYPYEDPVAVVCNGEEKIIGLPHNRALRDEEHKIYDIIAGDFFICRIEEDRFSSLSPELMNKFKGKFYYPQVFFKVNGEICALDITTKNPDKNNENEL